MPRMLSFMIFLTKQVELVLADSTMPRQPRRRFAAGGRTVRCWGFDSPVTFATTLSAIDCLPRHHPGTIFQTRRPTTMGDRRGHRALGGEKETLTSGK
jgi:hypothetical protein